MHEYRIQTTGDTDDLLVDGVRWRRDSDGNVFVYDVPEDETGADPVAEVDAEDFVSISTTDNATAVSDS